MKNYKKRSIAFNCEDKESIRKIIDIFEKAETSANIEILVKIFAERLIENADQAYEIFVFDNVFMSENTQKFVAQIYIEFMNYISELENCTYLEAIYRFEEYISKEI